MKRSMLVMSALMISSVIFAQTENKPHRGKDQLEKLKSELSLNDAQFATIKGINKKYAEQFSQLRKDSVTSRKEKFGTMKNLHDEREKEINAVLTPDQKVKLEELKKERSSRRIEHMKARHENRQAQMIKDLALTDDQVTKVKEANKVFVEKVKVLREQSDNNKEEMQKIRKEHESTMQSILTEDQFSKWKEMRKSANKKRKGGKRK